MNSRELVDGFLRELSQRAQFERIRLSEAGVCAFSVGNEIECVVEVPDNGEALCLYAPLAELPETGEWTRRLLEAHWCGHETGGAAFALQPQSRRVVLWFSAPVRALDYQGFENLIANFLESAEKWRARLGEWGLEPHALCDEARETHHLRA